MAQAANMVEKVLGHQGKAVTEQNMTNPARNREKYADPSGETMKALVWMGKNTVEVGQYSSTIFFSASPSHHILIQSIYDS